MSEGNHNGGQWGSQARPPLRAGVTTCRHSLTLRRRAITGLLGAVTSALPWLAAACGEATTPAKSAGPVTVRYMSNLPETHPEGAARLALLDEFNKTGGSQITVNVDDGRASSNIDKYKSLAAGGSPPDFAYLAFYDAADLYAASAVVDIDGELKGEKDWAKQRADLYPAMLESSTWTGKLVSIPEYTNDVALIYNTGLLSQAGVAPPRPGWTWDDFKTTALKFVRPNLIPLSLGWFSWTTWLGTTGATIISKDARKITADTPEMLQVMELWLGFIKSGISPADGTTETYRQAKNDTVFEVQGPYRIPTLRQVSAPDFGVIHIPVHPVKKQITAANGGHNAAVFKEIPAERRHAAALVAKWLNEPHAQAQMCIRATSLPVSKAALASKELQDYLMTDAPFKGFVDLAPYGWRFPALPSYPKISKALQDNIDAILKQEMGPKDGLAKAQREAQALLDDDIRLMR